MPPPGLLPLCVAVLAATVLSQQVITSDAYFYGESPEVPPPPGTGLGDWATAYAKATSLVAEMTLQEKVSLTGGASTTANGCSGYITPITRLGFPGLCLNDAGNGVRGTDFVNGYASGLSVGASWNRNLANQRGISLGGEFRTKGVNVALGPVVGPLGRVATAGRNWEGFTNDPYLNGELVYETVQGVQSTGVITSTKHYIAYEQETNRNPSTNANNQSVASVSSNVDDRTLHELYLWPFAEAVRAGTGNIMCSYNRINNSYACQNSYTQNRILKTELGFQGFVVSDWGAQHGGVASALAGLDMTMPSPSYFWGANLTIAVNNGSVPESRLNDMATRIIAAWYQMGQDTGFPTPGLGMANNYDRPHPIVNAKNPASKDTLLQGAIEGHVLVKNVNNALPLKNPQLLSLFGYDAQSPNHYDPGPVPPLSGWNGGDLSMDSRQGYTLMGVGHDFPQAAYNGTIISGGGSGAVTPAYISDPYSALAERAYQDGSSLFWDFGNVNATSYVDPESDACLVFINAFATEGWDRLGLHDDFSDALVNNIAAQCNNTIVVIHNAGIRLVDQWIENPNVTALIFAHVPGQDSGRALVEILYGDSGPSGRLPYTVAMNESQYGNLYLPDQPEGEFLLFPQSNFSEGVFIDYRAFDLAETPRYEFGYGLSYTTFSYSDISVSLTNASTGPYPTGQILPGGAEDLYDVLATVTAQVSNTGPVDGIEVPQLYVGIPGAGQPVRQLRGFSKVDIEPGTTTTVEFDLRRKDLSTWDVVAQQWLLQSGTYQIYVGASSRNLPLTSTLTIP